jgi:hypothetical protein
MNMHLHIVSFDLPFPPDYGGVIDVYYKIRFLSEAGVKVHLHYFSYGEARCDEAACQTGLNIYCESVHAYPRKTGWSSFLSRKPYIVFSRRSEELIGNLCNDDHPILFEGLHTCYCLDDPRLKGRLLLYRESNIEHQYYRHLAEAEHSLFRKIFFFTESLKLRSFEKVLGFSSRMMTVSLNDTEYLRNHFPGKEVLYIPSFHRDNDVVSLPGKGEYVLYQGNLSVPENISAVAYLLKNVWNVGLPELLIAGKNPSEQLIRLAAMHANVRVIANPDDNLMFRLLREAHVNLMLTFQPTGLKLKLLNALFNGRFCLVNEAMLAGTLLKPLCFIANTPQEFREKVLHLFSLSFTEEDAILRRNVLQESYSNHKNGELLLRAIWR